jgi:hypothetical protein
VGDIGYGVNVVLEGFCGKDDARQRGADGVSCREGFTERFQ